MANRRFFSSGFTLIELMIVVVLAAVIAVVALPSYRSSVIKANRRAAEAALMQAVQLQQQYLADQRTYASTSADLHFSPSDDVAKVYTFSFTVLAGPPPSFTATAAPKAGTGQSGDVTLTIDNLGNKTPSASW